MYTLTFSKQPRLGKKKKNLRQPYDTWSTKPRGAHTWVGLTSCRARDERVKRNSRSHIKFLTEQEQSPWGTESGRRGGRGF